MTRCITVSFQPYFYCWVPSLRGEKEKYKVPVRCQKERVQNKQAPL